MPRRRQQRSIETRAHIIEAAGELIATDGYRDTSYTDISARSQRAVGTVLHHFRYKQAIGVAVIEEQRARLRAIAESAPRPLDTDGLVDVLMRAAALVDDDPVVRAGIRLTMESKEDLELPAAWPFGEWRAYLTRILSQTETPDPTGTANTLTAIALGTLTPLQPKSTREQMQAALAFTLP